MPSTFINDIYLTNSVVAFLYAGFQGAFAGLNILSQLGYQHFNPDELSRVEKHLGEIEKWKEDLLRGLPILSVTWKSPQTVAAKKAFEDLSELRNDLLHTAGRVKKAVLFEDLSAVPEEVKYLIAAFARQAYARENYVRGFIEFGQSFKHQDVVDAYSGFLTETEAGIRAAHIFYDIFVSEENLFPEFFKGLREECSFLPGIYQAQVHDIALLLNSYTQNITYEKLGIMPQYSDSWKSIDVPPAVAGYWQAWEFAPEHAVPWLEAGMTDPRSARFWTFLGFGPAEALDWARLGFSPPAARAWLDRGYTPESALKALEDEAVRRRIESDQSAAAEASMAGKGETSNEEEKEPED